MGCTDIKTKAKSRTPVLLREASWLPYSRKRQPITGARLGPAGLISATMQPHLVCEQCNPPHPMGIHPPTLPVFFHPCQDVGESDMGLP